MANHKKDYIDLEIPIFPEGSISLVFLIFIYILFTSCATIAPNTTTAIEALPEGALTPLWMVLEGVFLDLVSLVKGLIF